MAFINPWVLSTQVAIAQRLRFIDPTDLSVTVSNLYIRGYTSIPYNWIDLLFKMAA